MTAFAHPRIENWPARDRRSDRTDIRAVAAISYAIYDGVDRVKACEARHDLDGADRFQKRCLRRLRISDAAETRERVAKTVKKWPR